MLGANPDEVKSGPEIEDILEELQSELNGDMSPMLGPCHQAKDIQKRPSLRGYG